MSIGTTPVEQVSQHCVLGVTIDDQFKWEAHTHNLCKKLSQNLFLLSRLQHFVNTDTRKLFFNAHIKPHIDYASVIWDNCSQNHFMKVNSLYRRSAKLILPDPSLSTDDKMKKLSIPPLDKHLKFNKGVLMYKIVRRQTPSYLSDLFERSQARYENLRNSLKVMRPRINLTKASLSYAGASLWNSLPTSLKEKTSIVSFKSGLHNYLNT